MINQLLMTKKDFNRGILSLFLSMLLVVPILNIETFKASAETNNDDLPPTGMTYENYPALKETYKDHFHFGIFGKGEVEGLLYNYASYTPGNEMKPENTQNEKGVFTYADADNAMETYSGGKSDMLFYGHTLAWHSQTPSWMWDAPPARYGQSGEYDRETALENLNTHIENVLGYYGSRLEGIDVVNEAIGTATPGDWKGSLAKGEGWYTALSWEWVEFAFLKAAEVVDENGWDVKLIYNDFGLDSPAKARVVYEMVKDINERYAGARENGKPLIEVIGMQGHYNLSTNAEDVEESIKLFATLPGVKVHITEMDIALPPGELTPENENNQGMKYAELFKVFKDYATGPGNTTDNPKVVETVKLAGVRDVESGWRGGEFAMPYDYDGKAKKALLGILYPEKFLTTHEYIEPDENETEYVDGVYVYDTSKGDSWSGANIILGNDASQWPWSTTDEDGEVAFIPEKDATYRLSFNYTAKGTNSIRIRWIKDNTNGGYTSKDGTVVNDYRYHADEVAKHIPAYFDSGMVNMGTYTLITEITLDGAEQADGLIGNIAIRGGAGGNAFSINWIQVEKIGANGDPDIVLVNWPGDIEGEEPVETEALEVLLAEVANYDSDDYTAESFGVLMSAVAEAERVLANEGTTQEEVVASLANVEAAINGLVAVDPDPEPEEPGEVDTSKLEQLLTEVEKLDPEAYTGESIMVLVEAFDEAIEVLLDPETTQEEVDMAVINLEAAIDGLVEIDPEPEPEDPKEDPKVEEPKEEPSEEPKDESKEPKKDDDVKIETEETNKSPVTVDNDDNVLPKTATNYFNWILAGLIMLMAGAVSLIMRKRRVN